MIFEGERANRQDPTTGGGGRQVMEINENSWHFKLYRLYKFLWHKNNFIKYDYSVDNIEGSSRHYLPTLKDLQRRDLQPVDFCQYSRTIILLLPLTILLNIAMYVPWLMFLGIVLRTSGHWSSFITGFTIVGSVIGILLLCLAAFVYARHLAEKRQVEYDAASAVEKQASFIKQSYLSVKHKYCPVIEVSK